MSGFYQDSIMRISPMNAKPSDLEAASQKSAFNVNVIDTQKGGVASELDVENQKVTAPVSIFRGEMTVNYRTLKSSFPRMVGSNEASTDFTNYSDYSTCMDADNEVKDFLKKMNDPSIENILSVYNGNKNSIDPYGLASYKLQDFIFCSDYGRIPNNRLITLRRYTMPTVDMMFGLDLSPKDVNAINQFPERNRAIATACTYINDDNKLSELLSMTYGMRWEKKKSEVQTMQDPNGPMNKQIEGWLDNVTDGKVSGGLGDIIARGIVSTINKEKVSATEMKFNAKNKIKDLYFNNYRDLIGPQNRIDETNWRLPGIDFNQTIKLTFKYDLRSLQFVNPKVAFLDLMSNFMLLTGNYATFWGGAIHYTGSPAVPEFGDKKLLIQGDYGGYVKSIFTDISGVMKSGGRKGTSLKDKSFLELAKDFLAGSFEALLSNILGDGSDASIGQVPKALLSGDPVGQWHLVIGNPLNPIAVIGNMILKDVAMSFNDTLGKDDFPTEMKFVVTLEHGMPRDNSGMQSIFNAGRGRVYIPIEQSGIKSTFSGNGDDRYPISNALYDIVVGNRTTDGNVNAVTDTAINKLIEIAKDTKKYVTE